MRKWVFLAVAMSLPLAATAQDKSGDGKFEQKAESVLRQPLKDFGIMSEKAPEILVAAQEAPYSLAGLRGCADYARAIAQLNEILGVDVDAVDEDGEPLPGRLAEAGARAAITSFIPFRGLVREATGAAESDRRLRAALVAGTARRSFLKGYARGRGCRV